MAVVVVAPLVAVDVVDPGAVVLVVLGARVVEVDDAEGEGVLEHAAAVSATTAVPIAAAARAVGRRRTMVEGYAGSGAHAGMRTRSGWPET